MTPTPAARRAARSRAARDAALAAARRFDLPAHDPVLLGDAPRRGRRRACATPPTSCCPKRDDPRLRCSRCTHLTTFLIGLRDHFGDAASWDASIRWFLGHL